MFRVLCAVTLCVASLSTICVEAGDPGCRYFSEEFSYHSQYRCKPGESGMFRDCEYCNKFVQCADGKPYEKTCNTDVRMYFNGRVCERDEDGSKCDTKYYQPTTVSTQKTPPPYVPTCTKPFCCVDTDEDCRGLPNGDYGSCSSCYSYVTCSNHHLVASRPCPAGLVWDDYKKRCEYISYTCRPGCFFAGNPFTSFYCQRVKPNTKLQSCNSCNSFVLCTSYSGPKEYKCPPGKYFDSQKEDCVEHSKTCTPDCKPISFQPCNPYTFEPYHLCSGCNNYASCVGFFFSRVNALSCKNGLVWDNNRRKCVARELSTTCGNDMPIIRRCEKLHCYTENRENDFQVCLQLDNVDFVEDKFMVHDKSAPCIRGETWKVENGQVLARRGCCFSFKVCPKYLYEY